MSDGRPQTTANKTELKVKTFRDLTVYSKSKELVLLIYKLIDRFPKNDFALRSQMQRAALNVPANIVEGQERYSDKESVRFLYIARGSLAELEAFLDISCSLKYISNDEFTNLNKLVTEIRKMINGLISYFKQQIEKKNRKNKSS